jgi:methylated-DNA-[protein]-cysteine S-methyltransferase
MNAVAPVLVYAARLKTPFAVLGIREQGGAIVAIDYLPVDSATTRPSTPLAREAARQIDAFVKDPHATFDLPVHPNGTPFEDRVWTAIRSIPAGQVRTYGDIARSLMTMPRAIGGACGRNPLPLVIPCHRVIAGGGGLGGFMRGRDDHALAIKRWLLRHEGVL